MIKKWVREHLHLGNAWERLFIYVAGAAEEELTMSERRGALPAASGLQQGFGDTLGRTRKSIGKELCEIFCKPEIV